MLSPTGLWNSNAVRKIDLKKPNIPVKTSWRGGDSPPAERGGTYPTKGWCGGSSATQVGEGRQWDFLYSSSQELYFFPKQLTVGVLNAILDLAALVLVGVVGFLGSEVVLSPVVSHCLRLSPFMWGVGVGWCGRLLGL